jgi:hypothetical protein
MHDSDSPLRLPALNEPGNLVDTEFLSQKDLLRNLILQIRKDFESAGIPIKLLLNKRYSFAELAQIISDAFMLAGATAMFNLLYRVDVSEKQLKDGMPTPGIDPILVAELVIKRELQKVVLKKQYSQG